MSEIKDNGGFAFPQPGVYDDGRNEVNPVGAYYDAGGMSLRDYFAAKAMQAHLQAAYMRGSSLLYLDVASEAYAAADAMLQARKP